MDLKELGEDGLKFLAGLLGVATGQVLASLVPSTGQPLVDKILPGGVNLAVAIAAALKMKDPYVKAGAFGMGISGTAQVINKFTEGKTGILDKVNKATALPTPSLNGFRGFRGIGNTAVAPAEAFLSGGMGYAPAQAFLS